MGEVKKLFSRNIRQYAMIIALIVIIILFAILTDGLMLTPLNLTNIVLQNAHIIILGIGMLFVIVAGAFDLSVGSAVALIGSLAGTFMVIWGWDPILSIILLLIIGCLLGAWEGMWIAYLRIPAFVVTLGNMLIFKGLMLLVLKSSSIGPFPGFFSGISLNFLPDPFATEDSLKWLTVIIGVIAALIYIQAALRKRNRRKKYGFEISSLRIFIAQILIMSVVIIGFSFILASHRGIPNVLVLLAVLIAIYSFLGNKTVIGRRVYALGGNERAALLSGIKVKRINFAVFVNMGLMAAVAGIAYTARCNYATPTAGDGFELDAIAACFIGGASSSGGIGTIAGAIVGALIMGVMNNGMSLLSLGIEFQQALKGMVLILAVLFDVMTKSKVASAN
ncbi:MAG: multiple monosaccharide ABC transporter permease [Christensenellales bacterium]